MIHTIKGSSGICDYSDIIAKTPRGYLDGMGVVRGRGEDIISTKGPETTVEFIHDNNEEEGSEGASLFYTFEHGLREGSLSRVEFHGKASVFVGVHD